MGVPTIGGSRGLGRLLIAHRQSRRQHATQCRPKLLCVHPTITRERVPQPSHDASDDASSSGGTGPSDAQPASVTSSGCHVHPGDDWHWTLGVTFPIVSMW